MANRKAALVFCALCLAVPQLTVAAEAEDRHPSLESPFTIDIGVFYPDRELDLRVNGTIAGINDEIDVDKRGGVLIPIHRINPRDFQVLSHALFWLR